jgi:hypothetical protein
MIPWWLHLWHSSYYARTLAVGALAFLCIGVIWLVARRVERRARVLHHQRVIAAAVDRARREKIMERLEQ